MKKGIWLLEQGDCREVVRRWADEGIRFDALVTDPPYDLTSIVKRFGKEGSAPAKSNGATGVYNRASRGFMGQQWDGTGVAFDPETWSVMYDALKPGAHLVAFGGTRTYHRMVCAIEDAGFEIRDTLMWVYSTGFPKSHDVSKGIDKAFGVERTEVVGVKPGHAGFADRQTKGHIDFKEATEGFDRPWMHDDTARKMYHMQTAPATPEAAKWAGWGTALKPAIEPIVLARKPLAGTVAANVLEHGVGGLNIDACRVGTSGGTKRSGQAEYPKNEDGTEDRSQNRARTGHDIVSLDYGRWPPNLLHDGSEEATALFPNAPGQLAAARRDGAPMNNKIFGERNHQSNANPNPRGDRGSAARFFPALGYSDEETRFHYSAKANKRDRAGSAHPTVKPQSLMKWLVRLITPPGGLILEPFGGSGSTLQAAVELGFDVMGVEMGEQYCQDIRNRMEVLKDG